jgi:type 1 glutamine amidotransferase
MPVCFAPLFAMVTLTASPGKATDPIRVLIVTGYDYPGHKWRLTTPALRGVLEKDKRFEVRVVEDPAFLESPALNDYDVVVLHFMNWERPAPGEGARKNLQAFVQGGKGLFVLHFACGAFDDWPEYRNLTGRVWDKKNTHDPRGPFEVKIANPDHPVTKGMASFQADDELYFCLVGERPIEVLATARSKVKKKDYPMAFVLSYGKGRVFNTPLGHDVKAIQMPGVAELIRRGCAWAAGRPVTP